MLLLDEALEQTQILGQDIGHSGQGGRRIVEARPHAGVGVEGEAPAAAVLQRRDQRRRVMTEADPDLDDPVGQRHVAHEKEVVGELGRLSAAE